MHQHPRHLLIPTILLIMLAAGCARQGTKPNAPATHVPTLHQSTQAPTPGQAQSAPPPGKTGILACDDYLANYKQCHRAAGIFAPDTIDKHYREIRGTLLRESRNPAQRSALAARCVSLTNLLKKALHGKSCKPAQPANTSDGH